MSKTYRAPNKRLIPRTSSGRFRKTTALDLGIGGVCPDCGGLLLRHYDGDEADPCPDPRRFRYRCFICEPRTEQESQPAPVGKSGLARMIEEAAASIESQHTAVPDEPDPPYPHRTRVCADCGTAVDEEDLADGNLCHICIKR